MILSWAGWTHPSQATSEGRNHTLDALYSSSGSDVSQSLDRYFAACDESGELYSEAGLALSLDVSLRQLRAWFDGDEDDPRCHAIQMAYLRIMRQIECGEGYRGLSALGALKLRQRRFGGYQDRADDHGGAVRITFGPGTEESDFD